jgi:hypothetical protein
MAHEDPDCITTDLENVNRADRPHVCIRRGVHWATCEHPETCRGCVPREAEHGLLCAVCWAKVEDALGRVEELIVHLRSIDSNGQAIGERVQTTMQKRLVVPDSWLAADGLMEALGSPAIPSTASIDEAFVIAKDAVGVWADPDPIVSTREGAKRAVVLVKRMQVALSRWPDSEVDWRRVPEILCPSCSQATLYRKGPLHFHDEIMVQCAESPLLYDRILDGEWEFGYPYCEFRMDWFEWLDRYSKPIEAAFAMFEKRRAT